MVACVTDLQGIALCLSDGAQSQIILQINLSLYRNNEDSFVDNLMLGVQLADVSTRCSSHQGRDLLGSVTDTSSNNL